MGRLGWPGRILTGARTTAVLAAGVVAAFAGETTGSVTEANVAIAGAYSFSDELGGFRIISASGSGSREDPITIVQEMFSATPVTIVIRTELPIRPYDWSGRYANGFMHMRLVMVNNSGHPWVEFELELQERLGVASVFGDGLSFDQRKTHTDNIYSDSFRAYDRDFEPYDRLLFRQGKVDVNATASVGFFVTDFTPRWEFFLRADPRIPFS